MNDTSPRLRLPGMKKKSPESKYKALTGRGLCGRIIIAQTTFWNAVVLLHPHAQTHAGRSRRPRVSGLAIGVLSRLSELAPRVLEDGQCCPFAVLTTHLSPRSLQQRPSRNLRPLVPRVGIPVDPMFVGLAGGGNWSITRRARCGHSSNLPNSLLG